MTNFNNFNLSNFKFTNWLHRPYDIIPMAHRNDISVTLTFPDTGSPAIHNKAGCLLF